MHLRCGALIKPLSFLLPQTPHPIFRNEPGAEKILHSRRQRCFGFPFVEASSDKCLRCHTGMESELPGSRAIWHILQVSGFVLSFRTVDHRN